MKVNPRMTRLFKYWLPVILWMSVIFSFSSYPVAGSSEIHWQDFIVKKTAHVVEYAVLSFLLYRALVNSKVDKRKALMLAFLISVVYGMTDEFHQGFTPGREPHIRDVGFDTIGAWLGLKLRPRLESLAKNLQKNFMGEK